MIYDILLFFEILEFILNNYFKIVLYQHSYFLTCLGGFCIFGTIFVLFYLAFMACIFMYVNVKGDTSCLMIFSFHMYSLSCIIMA